MLTDKPPRKSNLAAFTESDRMRTIDLPQDGSLRIIAKSVEGAMKAGTTTKVRHACQEFLETTSRFYGVSECEIRVLAARLLRGREDWAGGLFGAYDPETMVHRVRRRTAVREGITYTGTD